MKHPNFVDIVSDKGYWFSIAVGFALGLVTMFASSKIQVPFILVAVIIVIFLLIIWFLLIDIVNLKRAKPESLSLNQFIIKNNSAIVLLNPNGSLPISSYITLYFRKEEFESYLATAMVINIQENGLIQAKIIDWSSNNKIKQEALHNDVSFIRKVSVKPIITNNYIGGKLTWIS